MERRQISNEISNDKERKKKVPYVGVSGRTKEKLKQNVTILVLSVEDNAFFDQIKSTGGMTRWKDVKFRTEFRTTRYEEKKTICGRFR